MRPTELDCIDQKILEELQADARIPISTLATKVGLSRHAVTHRIDRLEAHKIITGYTIKVKERAPAKSLVRAIMMVYRKDRMRGADVTAAISKIPEVTYCAILSGEFDLMIHIEAESQERISDIWSFIANLPGVEDTRTAFQLYTTVDKKPR
ncbi:Lrp/AsnC family transcriptional regulator [Leeia sp. TBRC 13508]|uniref:Lrp/AsnC family transcriptional regulator n=1 Tax=Leeia speluncae TaxID=2884804 RepID=A0ABS8DAX8_9NEIS|nr:Lrp/AsnC family transcriptional regulator [Leeia speluncae]MCB6185371.1 Lrp/AsnC family transcriptional regulator [Leeia speluncae]